MTQNDDLGFHTTQQPPSLRVVAHFSLKTTENPERAAPQTIMPPIFPFPAFTPPVCLTLFHPHSLLFIHKSIESSSLSITYTFPACFSSIHFCRRSRCHIQSHTISSFFSYHKTISRYVKHVSHSQSTCLLHLFHTPCSIDVITKVTKRNRVPGCTPFSLARI